MDQLDTQSTTCCGHKDCLIIEPNMWDSDYPKWQAISNFHHLDRVCLLASLVTYVNAMRMASRRSGARKLLAIKSAIVTTVLGHIVHQWVGGGEVGCVVWWHGLGMGPVVVHGLDDSTALWLWQKIIIHRLYNDDDVAVAVAVAVAVGARVNYGPLDCTRGVYYHISGRRRQRHQPSSVRPGTGPTTTAKGICRNIGTGHRSERDAASWMANWKLLSASNRWTWNQLENLLWHGNSIGAHSTPSQESSDRPSCPAA